MGENLKFMGWVLIYTHQGLYIPNFIKIGQLEKNLPKKGGPPPKRGENGGECKIYKLGSYLYPSMITHTKFHRNWSIITVGPPKMVHGGAPPGGFEGSYEVDAHDQFCRSHHFKHQYIHQIPQNQNNFQVISLRQF